MRSKLGARFGVGQGLGRFGNLLGGLCPVSLFFPKLEYVSADELLVQPTQVAMEGERTGYHLVFEVRGSIPSNPEHCPMAGDCPKVAL